MPSRTSGKKIRVIRYEDMAPLIVSLERARTAAIGIPATSDTPRTARADDDYANRSRNEWTPRECLVASLAGIGFMALELPLALYYAARGRTADHKKKSRKKRISPRQMALPFPDR